MTASDKIPGTKKLAGVAVGVGTTETFEKKSRKTTGMPRVSSSVSPRRRVMWTSAPVWAVSGRRGSAVVLIGSVSAGAGRAGGAGPPGAPAARGAPGARAGRGRLVLAGRCPVGRRARHTDRLEVDVLERL